MRIMRTYASRMISLPFFGSRLLRPDNLGLAIDLVCEWQYVPPPFFFFACLWALCDLSGSHCQEGSQHFRSFSR